MSTGYLRYERKSDAELYKMLGEGDTPDLYARSTKLDTSHTIPYAGGNSVDGKTVYIDDQLYREVMDGKVKVEGMTPDQLIQAWLEHEHTEWAVDSGDNPVDRYDAAHEFAEAKEDKFVVRQVGVPRARYIEAIKPALERCARREPSNPPKDLWCAPYLDEPTPGDKEILAEFRKHGVVDAFKKSKVDVNYGIGQAQCRDCRHFSGGMKGPVRPCELVSGLVRNDRHCDLWHRA
jgi:hypothetical protein